MVKKSGVIWTKIFGFEKMVKKGMSNLDQNISLRKKWLKSMSSLDQKYFASQKWFKKRE